MWLWIILIAGICYAVKVSQKKENGEGQIEKQKEAGRVALAGVFVEALKRTNVDYEKKVQDGQVTGFVIGGNAQYIYIFDDETFMIEVVALRRRFDITDEIVLKNLYELTCRINKKNPYFRLELSVKNDQLEVSSVNFVHCADTIPSIMMVLVLLRDTLEFNDYLPAFKAILDGEASSAEEALAKYFDEDEEEMGQ